ncbi:DUF222 domain-containing protein [Actinopolymorpha sp. B11F2]|uniref:HNH endonuclease signature motif containing protein n=1 Tax=Actinopolymorpha sp. B11F2 TaxID=3160862 RepID=UPI0032E42A93
MLEQLLGWSAYHADWYLDLALLLRTIPRTRAALAAGQLELADARAIAERIRVLETAEERRAVEDALFPDVLGLRAGLLRIRVEAEVLKINPEAAVLRHKRARANRGVDVYPAIDGVADLRLHGIPADQAVEAYAYLDAMARSMKSAGDERTLPQLRADIAASLLSGRADITTCGSGDASRAAADGSSPAGSDATDTDPGCSHTGCDHEHHDRYCPCPDCKPATYRPDPAGSSGPAGRDGRAAGWAGRDGRAAGDQAGRDDQEAGGDACSGRDQGVTDGQLDGQEHADPAGGWDHADRQSAGFQRPLVRTRAKIQLTIPLLALLNVSGQPAELGGYGPILLETARRIMANHLDNPDALFTVGVTHPITGRLLSLHPVPRRFLRGLAAELVEALNQRCVWPTCRRPANTCQLDHTTDHADGGETSIDNSGTMCPRHHAVKSGAEWKLQQPTPGHFTFTDPRGRTYRTEPPRLTDPDPLADGDPPPF